ncbi:MAG: hypothetical protein K0U93_27405 [Gammaproteobacteria bacterium]|nr:hypothetical protein [Gammaproteobacteria bacterium]
MRETVTHVFDLIIGAIAAFIGWGIYHWTDQPVWSLLFFVITAAVMIWLVPRWRGTDDDPDHPTQPG